MFACNLNKPKTVPIQINSPLKVIIITIDGTRWQDVFNGTDSMLSHRPNIPAREIMPNLYHFFVDNGTVIGQKSLMIASNPAHVSLPGYLEIMRGYQTLDCSNNNCEISTISTIIPDYFQNPAVFSSWEKISKIFINHSNVVYSCGRSFRSSNFPPILDDQSFVASDFNYDFQYRPDSLTQSEALSYFSLNHPDFLWVALGNTDEYAHTNNYDKYIEALKSADSFIGNLMKDPNINNYIIIVTVDHGRGNDWTSHGSDSESAKVWLMMRGPNIPIQNLYFNNTVSLANIFPIILYLKNNSNTYNSLLGN